MFERSSYDLVARSPASIPDADRAAALSRSQRASAIGERPFLEGRYISQLLHSSPPFAFPSGYPASDIRRSVHRTRPPIAISR